VRSWKDQRRPLRESQPNSRTSSSSVSTNAFERLMAEAMDLRPTRLLAYCLMPNHRHMLRPRVEGELSAFVGWQSLTDATRYRTHNHDGVPVTCTSSGTSRFQPRGRALFEGGPLALLAGLPSGPVFPARERVFFRIVLTL